jgi:hypothetical protein
MSAAVKAITGAMSAPMMATMSAPMTPPNALASRPPSAPTTIAMSQTSRIVPKTCQPLPLTSSRLRPKAARMPGRSTTVTGITTDQMVSRIRPGMMMRTNPIATPMPNRIDTTITGTRTGVTLLNSSPSELSRWPSCRSRTSMTTMPVKNAVRTSDTMLPMKSRLSGSTRLTTNCAR